jgi:hypothetical protein
MFGLLTVLATATAIEIAELFTTGALLAATVYTAAKTGKRDSKSSTRKH